jgi:hypothetical protein
MDVQDWSLDRISKNYTNVLIVDIHAHNLLRYALENDIVTQKQT